MWSVLFFAYVGDFYRPVGYDTKAFAHTSLARISHKSTPVNKQTKKAVKAILGWLPLSLLILPVRNWAHTSLCKLAFFVPKDIKMTVHKSS